MAGRDEQRLAAYPAQSGLDGELFFEQRGRIDERPAAESGNGGFQMFQHAVQHSFYRRVIVRRAGIGGDFGAVSGGIPFADAAFVTYGADHRRTRPFDEFARIGAFLDIAFHVGQRRLITLAQPRPEPRLVLSHVAAGRKAAEIESCVGGKFFDVLIVEHSDKFVPKIVFFNRKLVISPQTFTLFGRS